MAHSYTHYMCCRDCGQVAILVEQETVDRWPNGYPRFSFRHTCAKTKEGQGTTAPRKIPNGPLDREAALALIPFGKLDWPS